MSDTKTNEPQVRRIAADLRTIADRLETVPDLRSTYGPYGDEFADLTYVRLSILPTNAAREAVRLATIDAIGQALFCKPGQPEQGTTGARTYKAEGAVGLVHIAVHTSISSAEDEVKRLRAELADAKAKLAANGVAS